MKNSTVIIFGLSALLFIFTTVTAGVRVETTQLNGLGEIQYPLSGFATAAYWLSLYFLVFGIIVGLGANSWWRKKDPDQSKRFLIGSGLLSLGLTSIALTTFLTWIDLDSYGLLCASVTCRPYFVQDVQQVIVLAAIVTLSAASMFAGVWCLRRNGSSNHDVLRKSSEQFMSTGR